MKKWGKGLVLAVCVAAMFVFASCGDSGSMTIDGEVYTSGQIQEIVDHAVWRLEHVTNVAWEVTGTQAREDYIIIYVQGEVIEYSGKVDAGIIVRTAGTLVDGGHYSRVREYHFWDGEDWITGTPVSETLNLAIAMLITR